MAVKKLESVPVEALIPYARNSRTHSDEQVAQIAASIREFGFNNPVLVGADNDIIAGHGRVLAARKLGLNAVPCLRLDHLTEAQKRAYVIADNKLALNAGWDDELLKLELVSLRDEEAFDLALTGFSNSELEALLAVQTIEGETDADEVPEPPAIPITVLGDLWTLGTHRIICGDSTFIDTVQKLLGGVEPHLMVTDPPYGVEYDASWRDQVLGGKEGGRATGKVLNDEKADWRDAWALFPGDVAYVWHADRFSPLVADSLEFCGFQMRAMIVWGKSQHTFGRGHYHSQHEPCWYAVKKSGTGHWAGDRKQTTLWEIPKPSKSETGHGTQKPVECMKRPIENNSLPGQAVYEPFSGSGTTIIAAEMTGRCCYAVELNPAYVDVAITRWQDFTGKKAVHESGKAFDEMKTERQK
jgi:DNA modification methylase